MIAACVLFLSASWGADGALDEARSLIRRGLLAEAERLLDPLVDEARPEDRASALLLLGNVDYERGHYEQAVDHYSRAESSATAGGPTSAAARANRGLAEQRLEREREVSGFRLRLRAGLGATVTLALATVAWLARRSRPELAAGS